jgi:hypothetical protein
VAARARGGGGDAMKIQCCIAWTALIVASVTIFWWNMRSGSFFRLMMRHDAHSSAVIMAKQIEDLDETAKRLAPNEGNLALAFRGYSPLKEDDTNFAARVFFRMNYTLHPQRVYPLIPDETAVNTGDDLLIGGAPPSPQWLTDRGVRMIALFSMTPNGETFVQPIPVNAPQ